MPKGRLKKTRWALYLLLVLLGAATLCFSIVDICPLLEFFLPITELSRGSVTDFIRSLGAWGPAASIGLMIVHSFVPFPAEFLTIANGMLFGPFWGVLITWTGAMLGAYASFGLTRAYGRPFVADRVSHKQLEKLDRWVEVQGAPSLLLSRLIPLISFNLINYGAGMTRISWWTFTWTTGLGILPITLFMVVMGDSFDILPWWAWLLVLLAFVGAVSLMTSLHGKHRRKHPRR
jgi:uncharacterized membrane protein YdjX (TVP38/TMEM64 family)